MGTILSLMERLAQRATPGRMPVAVTPFGFTVGSIFVAWQRVSAIAACMVDRTTADALSLEFAFDDQTLSVSELQPGFDLLEAAMVACFPTTADWRQRVLHAPCDPFRTLLFKRAP